MIGAVSLRDRLALDGPISGFNPSRATPPDFLTGVVSCWIRHQSPSELRTSFQARSSTQSCAPYRQDFAVFCRFIARHHNSALRFFQIGIKMRKPQIQENELISVRRSILSFSHRVFALSLFVSIGSSAFCLPPAVHHPLDALIPDEYW